MTDLLLQQLGGRDLEEKGRGRRAKKLFGAVFSLWVADEGAVAAVAAAAATYLAGK